MISSEVERTLVKSPPELWTELSDPTALARHLGEFGDIRITRVEPEHAVEWEAESTSGKVQIKPSGWGTKVTLSVSWEPSVAAEPTKEPTDTVEPVLDECHGVEVGVDTESEAHAAAGTEAEAGGEFEDEPEAGDRSQPEQLLSEAETKPRRGFFARLFSGRRRRKDATEPPNTMSMANMELEPPETNAGTVIEPIRAPGPQPEPPRAFAAVSQALSSEAIATLNLFPASPTVDAAPHASESKAQPERTRDEARDLSAELKSVEEVTAEEVTAVLTAALDRLGAAHHRPFSRA